MTHLDALLARSDDHPDSPAFRRALLIELRKVTIVRRGVALRLRKGRA